MYNKDVYMHTSVKLLVFLPLALVCLNLNYMVTGKEYYVSAHAGDASDSCKEKYQCITLSQFSDDDSILYSDSNIVLIFLPGHHYLESELIVSSIDQFQMVSASSRAVVICDKSSNLQWSSIYHVLISNMEFSGCGVNNVNTVTQFDVVNSTFVGSATSGTALKISRSNVAITKSVFIFNVVGCSHKPMILLQSQSSLQQHTISNYSPNETVHVGGAILATEASSVIINECLFKGNSAELGGAIFAEQNSKITISHSIIRGHISSSIFSGAALYSENNCIVSISNTVISDNRVSNSGGAFFLYNSSLVANQCAFFNNSAQQGGFVVAYLSTVSISECQVSSSTAYCQHNVALNVDDQRGQNGDESKNEALNCSGEIGGYGGALHVETSRVVLEMTKFSDNRAIKDGGVIQAYSGSFMLCRCNFTGNIANQRGGAISTTDSDLKINQCHFYNNKANDIGGAIFAIGASDGTATNLNRASSEENRVQFNMLFSYQSKYYSNYADYGGALFLERMEVTIKENYFFDNSAVNNGGTMILRQSHAIVYDSNFTQNKAENGGGIYSGYKSIAVIESCTFSFNRVTNDAGALLSDRSIVTIQESTFRNNSAKWGGAVAAYEKANINIKASLFNYNRAIWGGALALHLGTLIVKNTILSHQQATKEGGVVYVHSGLFIAEESALRYNNAEENGGAIMGVDAKLIITECNLTHNDARYYGSVIHWSQGKINTYGEMLVEFNSAQTGLIYLYRSTASFTGNTLIKHNLGSLYTFNSHVTFSGVTIFKNCSTKHTDPSNVSMTEITKLEGGAVSATFQSIITFNRYCEVINNRAKVGGGFFVTESMVYFNGGGLIANNQASDIGGGVYLYQSEMNCMMECNLQIQNNSASKTGGGIHSISSLIRINNLHSTLHFSENKADKGGGIYLEMNAKIFIIDNGQNVNSSLAISFIENWAMIKGGALYVLDGPRACKSLNALPYTTSECFLQIVEQREIQPSYLSTRQSFNETNTDSVRVHFFNNTAKSGSSIYGGLISGCTISGSNLDRDQRQLKSNYSPGAVTIVKGTSYIKKISNIDLTSISSDPIQICVCRNGWPACSYQPCPIKIMKGGTFSVSVAAVDQTNQPIAATVYSYFRSAENDLTKHFFKTDRSNYSEVCTNLKFNSSARGNSPDDLILQVEGPCRDTELSKRRFEIDFYSCPKCPIGFEPLTGSTRCECICDSSLQPYITRCNSSAGTLVRESNFWLAYINQTKSEGYVLYPYCPLDYCHPPSSNVEINLNIPDGSDAQCAFNRTGLLCGRCQPGLSLSLGSSLCLPCKDNWSLNFVLITLAGLTAGIVLTFTILVLNFTVAVGLINGVLFYSNVLASSYSTFLSSRQPASELASGVLAFFNLDVPFNACYIKGLDTYTKTWLQLFFPFYLFTLVLAIIKLSQCSSRFSNLIGKKNPVATLSTLILLSYSKILSITISAISYTDLNYPKGSHTYKRVWSEDATLEYLSRKHIALVAVSAFIYLIGFAYTALLFSWQWLLPVQHWRVLSWTTNPRLMTFIETYNAPYSAKHRYWTGLLLIVRALLYLVATLNTSGNPQITLASTAFIMGCLFFWKSLIGTRIYKNWIIDTIDTFVSFNILTLTIFTWLLQDKNRDTVIVQTISAGMIYLLLIMAVVIVICRSRCCRRKYERVHENDAIQLAERGPDIREPQPKEPTQTILEFPKQKQL